MINQLTRGLISVLLCLALGHATAQGQAAGGGAGAGGGQSGGNSGDGGGGGSVWLPPKPRKPLEPPRIKREARDHRPERKRIKRKPPRPQPVRQRLEQAPSGMPTTEEARFLDNEVIVRFQLTARQSAMDRLVARLGLEHQEARTFALAGVTVHRYRIASNRNVRDVIAALEADPSVVNAQPDYLYRLQQTTSAKPQQYALDRLSIGKAHQVSRGEGAKVAVIDSAIDPAHPAFAQTAMETFDVRDKADTELTAHGTSIASVIGASGPLAGIAPKADLVAIAAFWQNDNGTTHSNSWVIAKALDTAARASTTILNLSFAGPRDPLVEKSLSGADKRGMIAIAAAGNAGPTAAPLYPAAYDSVIAVTATGPDDTIFEMANQGPYIAFAAPGVDVLAATPHGGYGFSSGTSLATAHISGIAALLHKTHQKMNRDRLSDLLARASTDLGDVGRDKVFGAGIPDAEKALSAQTN